MRQCDLPAHVAVYYVIALALYMQSSYREVLRCLLEGIQWLREPSAGIKVAGNSGISQARTRLGWEPLQKLHDEVVKPIAEALKTVTGSDTNPDCEGHYSHKQQSETGQKLTRSANWIWRLAPRPTTFSTV